MDSHLPGPKVLRGNMTEPVGKGRCGDGCRPVRAIPCCYPNWLFSTTVPLACDDTEERETACFEEAEEETGSKESREAMARGHCSLSDTPSKYEYWHEDAVGDFDDENGGERLPGQLCNGCNRADQRVLVPCEVRVLLEAKCSAIAEDRLIQDL